MDPELRRTIESWAPDPAAAPESADWFPPIFDEAPFGIAAIDMTGHWVRVNPACAALHGRTREEMEGSYALQSRTDPVNTLEYERTLERARDGDVDKYQAEHPIICPDGTQRWALVT